MEIYAYVRVSTKEQHVDRQLSALKPYGVPKKNIYYDYQSGKDFERAGYKKLMRKLKRGDLLLIKSIDRLGRNYDEILAQWLYLTKQKRVDIKVLDMELLDTRSQNDNLIGILIADLVLEVFAYVAHVEREMIRQRQAEGIAAAKERGVKFGPTPMAKPEEFASVYRKHKEGQMSQRMAAKELNVSRFTVSKWIKEEDEKCMVGDRPQM